MELNATLLIQMFNFFVAWLLLRQLYFKPAITFLAKKEQEHDHLMQTMRRHQSELQVTEHEISTLWNALKGYSTMHKPDITHPDFFIFKHIAPLPQPVTLDTEQVHELTRHIKHAIVTEASHVQL